MIQPSVNKGITVQQEQLLAALSRLFKQAKRFYQQSSEAASPGNLRRQFTALAELHQQIVYLLPSTTHRNTSTNATIDALSELSYWYSQAPGQLSPQNIQRQLTKQLQLQKSIIRNTDLYQHQMTLLHFTASLQIAADQLARAL